MYRKETVEVLLKGKSAMAMVYVMNDKYLVGTPSKHYYNTILDGYNSFDLDVGMLDEAVRLSSKAQ